jgi:hypothetical protein
MYIITRADGALFVGYEHIPGLTQRHMRAVFAIPTSQAPVQAVVYQSEAHADETCTDLKVKHHDVDYINIDCTENEEALKSRVEELEALRPHWAQGHTDDSMAAQHATGALCKLWAMLGVTNQTQAVQKLQQVLKSEGVIANDYTERAFQHLYNAYGKPRDKFSNDGDAYMHMRGELTKAYTCLQRATGRTK